MSTATRELDATIAAKPIELEAADAVRLSGRVYEPTRAAEMTVLMLPGIGISQRLFRRVGPWLAHHGARACGFDYRGIGESANAAGRASASLTRWGQLDAAAAFRYCERRWSEPVVLLGHSFGGQVLGLTSELARARAAILVGSQLGQIRHWDGWGRAALLAYWYLVVPLACLVFDPLPTVLAFGTRLPRGAAREWARWGRSPDWLLSFHPEARANFAAFRAPVLAYAVADDWVAPPRAVSALLAVLTEAHVEHRELAPDELGLTALGHVGVFRNPACEPIWHEMLGFMRASLTASATR